MPDSYVCSGAVMRCTMGTSPANLTVLPIRTVNLTGPPMANISDHKSMVNLAPFGLCRSLGFPPTASATAAAHGHLTPMPCMHNTPAPWMGGKMDYLIKGQPALLKSCKCQCMWGGTISLINDGQVGEGVQWVMKKNKQQFTKSQHSAEQDSTDEAADTSKDTEIRSRKEAIENNQYQLKAKTVDEVEKEIAKNLGITCNFEGFTDEDLPQMQDIYSSVATHLDKYPALKKHINFVGSMQGRNSLFYDKFYQKLKANYPESPDAFIQKIAKNYANQYAPIPDDAYAYSAPSTKFNLNGLTFNASYKGDKVQEDLNNDLKAKWHPDGCNTIKSVFDHELGHKIDETLDLNSDPEFLKIFEAAEKEGKEYIKDNLSEYAYKQSNVSGNYDPKKEFIAEAWSEYLNNPKPRPIAKSVGDLIVNKTNWKK